MPEEKSLLSVEFEKVEEHLDKIISILNRESGKRQYFRIRSNPGSNPEFSIKTPYPLVNGNPVVGTLDGEPRNGYLYNGYAVYSVPDPTEQEHYIGEFILSEEAPIVWFDGATSNPYPGIREIIEE